MQYNHTSHSRQETTTDIHLHHRVQTVRGTPWHQFAQQSGTNTIRVHRMLYCHVMHRCRERNIVIGEERSLTVDMTLLSHATVEHSSYQPSLR